MLPTAPHLLPPPPFGVWGVNQVHPTWSFWNEEEPVCCGELVGKLDHTYQGGKVSSGPHTQVSTVSGQGVGMGQGHLV